MILDAAEHLSLLLRLLVCELFQVIFRFLVLPFAFSKVIARMSLSIM